MLNNFSVFEEVASSFENWSKTHKIALYSTGTTDAQKLLFSKTTTGDLTSHITKYYDQSVVGEKTKKESYENIAKDLEVACDEIVFVSDLPEGSVLLDLQNDIRYIVKFLLFRGKSRPRRRFDRRGDCPRRKRSNSRRREERTYCCI